MQQAIVAMIAVLIGVRSAALALPVSEQEASESSARELLDGLEQDILEINYNTTLQTWNYETNITDDTLDMRNDAVDDQSRFLKVLPNCHPHATGARTRGAQSLNGGILQQNSMVPLVLAVVLLVATGAAVGADPELERSELDARRYLIDLEEEILARNNNATELSWAYESNITEQALKQRNEAASRNANFFKLITHVTAGIGLNRARLWSAGSAQFIRRSVDGESGTDRDEATDLLVLASV
uniref:Uncharacterized protein n=1 Tax=Anopheles farauti TaxID=69004 RepID=A0A182QM29_9DIPT